jgi:hypothetical protein
MFLLYSWVLTQSATHLVWMVGSGGDAAKVTELHLILGVQQQVLQLHVSEKTNYVITLVNNSILFSNVYRCGTYLCSRARRSSNSCASACCTAGPSSNPGSAPQGALY